MLQILPYAIAVLLTFLVTLSAFPAVSAQVLHHLLYFLILTSRCRLCPPRMPTRCGRASSMFQLPASYSSTSETMLAGALHALQFESVHFSWWRWWLTVPLGSWLAWSSGQNQGKWAPTLLLVLPWQGLCPFHGFPFARLAQLQSHLKLQVCVHPTFPHLQCSSQWPWFDRCVPGLRRCLHHRHGNLQVSIKLSGITEISS